MLLGLSRGILAALAAVLIVRVLKVALERWRGGVTREGLAVAAALIGALVMILAE
jgi:hypothetical protein